MKTSLVASALSWVGFRLIGVVVSVPFMFPVLTRVASMGSESIEIEWTVSTCVSVKSLVNTFNIIVTAIDS